MYETDGQEATLYSLTRLTVEKVSLVGERDCEKARKSIENYRCRFN